MRNVSGNAFVTACLVVALTTSVDEPRSQATYGQEEPGWSNSTELSVVVTEGNAKAQTFGFQNTLRRTWKRSHFQLKVDGLQSNEADDRFLLIEPGIMFEPGETPPPASSSVVEPSIEPDVEKYFLEGRYDQLIKGPLFWAVALGWDRNEDAGILNRYVAFGGIGHNWMNREDLRFSTAYGLSYTDRQEDEVDPEKDPKFGGIRVFTDFLKKFGKDSYYDSDFRANVSLKDSNDYSLDLTNSIAVSITRHLKLQVSLQWLFEKEPALEDVDVFARATLIDPDGIAGNGDEFFETTKSGGFEIEVGEGDIRWETLDTILRTSLIFDF